ncbi:MAG: glutamate ligase domain-containing protein, partial [Rhizobiaceae bacterium]
GKAIYNVVNAMFATAMAFSFGVDLDNIRHGLRTFDTSFFQAPGRTNVFDEHPFKVLLDYAHNPAAFMALSDLVDRLDVAGRRIMVVSVPGDRRDQDVMEATRILAPHFDHFICKADDGRRGRGHDEIPNMLRDGLIKHGVAPEAITVIPSEMEALDHALNMAADGDLVVINGDDTARCWKQIIYFKKEGSERPAPVASKPPRAPVEIADPITDGDTLIRDERGVRLARSSGEAGD